MAALRGVSRSACGLPLQQVARPAYATCSRRSASTQAAESASPVLDLETESSIGVPQLSPEEKKEFRPWKRAADRKLPLPGSRYQYHPPKYDRGPLHPIQSPNQSDPIARDFVPGPFSLPRLRQTFQSTISSENAQGAACRAFAHMGRLVSIPQEPSQASTSRSPRATPQRTRHHFQ
jgi:large subunit ribosomal protein L5